MRRLQFLLAFLIASAISATAPAAIIVNGSFEEGPVITGSYLVVADGDTSITGWTVKTPVAGRNIDIITTYWQQADGQRSLDLNGSNGPGGIAQMLQTTAQHLYEVSFLMAGNPDGDPAEKTLRVLAAGQSHDFVFDDANYSRTNMGWALQVWTFTATDTSTELWFQMVDPDSGKFGSALDDVQVIDCGVVPEPSTLTLWSTLGLSACAVLWRARRQRGGCCVDRIDRAARRV